MRAIFSLRKHSYLKLIGTVLIAVALIAGIVGCDGTTPTGYDLTMEVSPSGGGVATDETGSSPYAAGTDVSIKAVANAGYVFDSWSASTGTFADEDAPETTFTMPAQDITVTANFIEVAPLDHFKVYEYDYLIPPYMDEEVYLEDQFCALNATVGYASHFADPVEKVHGGLTTPITSPDHHFMVYLLDYEAEPQEWHVTVSNQFGDNQELTVSGPISLVVPTQLEGSEEPVGLDHYMLYEVVESDYDEEEVINVSLKDDLINEPAAYDVYEPVYFVNPVRKTHDGEVTEILKPDLHAVIYRVWSEGEQLQTTVHVNNQFGPLDFDIYQDEYARLAVPSEKLDWEPVVPLDHFKFYQAEDVEGLPVGADVFLEDQFCALNATVGAAVGFYNPAEKVHNDITTPILDPDRHFTAYNISYAGEPQEWVVEVDNQFGEYQQLVVSGPVGLLVPTQKEGHDAPVDLDHYLMYQVIDGPYIDEIVELNDQFLEEPEPVFEVIGPALFANPVRKTHGAEVTEILHPEDHLVFYFGGAPGENFETTVQVTNQFGDQVLHVHVTLEEMSAIAVPSEKLDYWEAEPQPDDPLAFAAVLGDYSSQLNYLLRANDFWTDQRDWDIISDIGDYDVVVVNMPDDPGQTTFQAFLDAADANGVGVVFTSSFSSGDPWGISLLEWYLGDPAGQGTDYWNGDVYYKVTQDHAIFDGWTVDDEITIITGGDCDHAWFSSYSGTTIADVGNADYGIQGDAVAVSTYGASTHILLASLGPQGYTDMTAWTDDGKTILVNAVSFAAGI